MLDNCLKKSGADFSISRARFSCWTTTYVKSARIVELKKSSVNPTIEQLIEEFSAFDVNGIIENLIKADLIFKGGKLEN